ncbi:unnamed protein product [Linum tenue]|uniref:Uncharacterized protein n=1 Tax=Linum tenue TaxID=586396 RepID=A0AAV0PF44_9ROSI|nr:unnamed protein product [Linum tenue]
MESPPSMGSSPTISTLRYGLSWAILNFGCFSQIFFRWTFTLVMVYFALGTVISAYGCYWESQNQSPSGAGTAEASLFLETGLDDNDKGGRGIRGTDETVQLKAGFWGYLMLTVYQTCGGAVILTDIVFWCLLLPFQSDEHFHLDVLMGCIHSLNVAFLILDTILNNLPFPWFGFLYFVLWSCVYMVFQWALHVGGISGWPYEFLELNTPWAPLWYFAIAVVHVPFYGMYVLLVKAKYSLLPKWFPGAFVSRSYP